MFESSLLTILLIFPLFGSFILLWVPAYLKILLKQITLIISGFVFIYSLFLGLIFDKTIGSFQFVSKILWLPFLNINLHLGIDGISLFFLILTTLLIFVCLLACWNNIQYDLKYYLFFFCY